jgi:hypothetical protein
MQSLLRRLQLAGQPADLLRFNRVVDNDSFRVLAPDAFESSEVAASGRGFDGNHYHAKLAARAAWMFEHRERE